jgi:hypothetical protein
MSQPFQPKNQQLKKVGPAQGRLIGAGQKRIERMVAKSHLSETD